MARSGPWTWSSALAAKAYGRPVAGGRGAYVSFPVPDRPEISALITAAADAASRRWAAHI